MNFFKPYFDSNTNSCPVYLFKYISFDKQKNIEDILILNQLYFSLPSEFSQNDVLDSRTYNIVIKSKEDRRQWIKAEINAKHSALPRFQRKKILRSKVHEHKDPNSLFYRQRIDNLNRIFKERVNKSRVCCFCVTDSPDRTDMWKQYIPSGQGVSIKLNIEIIVKQLATSVISNSNISPHLFYLQPVNYVSSPLEISFCDLLRAEPLSLGITLLYTKLSSFAFEQEWRFSIYDCIDQSIPFPPEFIEEVILGPNVTEAQIKLVEDWDNGRSISFKICKNKNKY